MRRILFALVLAGCGPVLELPLFDEPSVLAAHPELRGCLLPVSAYREPADTPSATAWTEEDARVVKGGETLRIAVEGESDLSRDVRVAPDGSFDFPTVGRIPADGRTVKAVREDLARSLQSRVRTPRVRVMAPREVECVIDVAGKVNQPRMVRAKFRPWLSGAVSMAGGFSKRANLTQILVVRPAEKKVLLCDLYAFSESGESAQNPVLRDGDIVVATELYPPDDRPYAIEWAAVAEFVSGRIDREAFLKRLRESPPSR
jgi:polysaccharide export outer membrane protein